MIGTGAAHLFAEIDHLATVRIAALAEWLR
jgi:hypothetical protein